MGRDSVMNPGFLLIVTDTDSDREDPNINGAMWHHFTATDPAKCNMPTMGGRCNMWAKCGYDQDPTGHFKEGLSAEEREEK